MERRKGSRSRFSLGARAEGVHRAKGSHRAGGEQADKGTRVEGCLRADDQAGERQAYFSFGFGSPAIGNRSSGE